MRFLILANAIYANNYVFYGTDSRQPGSVARGTALFRPETRFAPPIGLAARKSRQGSNLVIFSVVIVL